MKNITISIWIANDKLLDYRFYNIKYPEINDAFESIRHTYRNLPGRCLR